MYIDTHCHLEDERFLEIDKTVDEFRENGVKYAINMGCDVSTSKKAQKLAQNYNEIYFAVGFHPENADDFSLEKLQELEQLATSDKCVAIGEIGLDYHWRKDNIERQKVCFIEQLKLADKLSLPVCIHSRDATFDTLSLLQENKNLLKNGGVMHCYSGSIESAKEYVKLGLKIGFGGTVTFKNAKNLVEVARQIPMDAILTETDSPYLSPEPKRGQLNSPANIPLVVGKLAFIREISPDLMAKTVMENAKKLFSKIGD